MLSKTSAYAKGYDGQNKWIWFLIEGDDLLEKYNTVWDSESVCNKKILRTKIKFHGEIKSHRFLW